MKKSNVTLYIIAIIVSAFLLWLWFHLGFNHDDAPFDLVLSIIWWLLVAGSCLAIHRAESKRREHLRTCFVAKRSVFNPEAGTRAISSPEEAVSSMKAIIGGLEYGFDFDDLPESTPFRLVVRSKTFKRNRTGQANSRENDSMDWKGEVSLANRPGAEAIPFASEAELLSLVRSHAFA